MMLVHAETVPSELLRVFELIQVLVVQLAPDLGVVVAIGQRHPRRGFVVGHHVGHQMEVVELHAGRSSLPQKSTTAAATASGSSMCGTWPESGNVTRRAPGIARVHASAHSRGARRSCSPQQSSVRALMRGSRRFSNGLYRYGFHATRASAELCRKSSASASTESPCGINARAASALWKIVGSISGSSMPKRNG